MKFIGQMANVSFSTTLGDDVLQLLEFKNFHNIWISVKNNRQGEKSTRDYLSLLDNKTLSQLIKVYQPDFEMFQYSSNVI